MNPLASAVHDATHRVPGVPEHSDQRAAHRPHRGRANTPHLPHVQDRNARRQSPPRVLVAWQNWIGRHLGGSERG
ncbi:hypothetical protein WDJ51_10065 [Rathayibacter sp. YIM 133350]|uniref:hypothetical protein n=1 Tax=Rathayibacter sp. YIM 133350 TaxID=3131992 RepID=UPI00307ED094